MSDPIDTAVDTAFGLAPVSPESSITSNLFDELMRQQRQIIDLQTDAIEARSAVHRQEVDYMMAAVLKMSEENTRLTVQKLDGLVRLFERMGLIDLQLEVDPTI